VIFSRLEAHVANEKTGFSDDVLFGKHETRQAKTL
jgi:hypothetical protein